MSLWRYERKFIIPNHDFQDVTLSLLLHPAKFSEIYHQRRVNSLYLDSEEFDCVLENYYGSPTKNKVRVRWYGKNITDIKKPVIEIKSKIGSVGKKISFKFNEFEKFNLPRGVSEVEFRNLVINSSLPDDYKTRISLLKPSLITTYERRYFESFNRLFRATIDFNISFFNPSNFMHYIPHDFKKSIILEIKYKNESDITAQQIFHKLPFRLGKFSKYVNGIEELWAH